MEPLWGPGPRMGEGYKNAQHLWALQNRHQVAAELSHRVFRWVCPPFMARGVLTPLIHSDSHHLWEGLNKFQLWERSTADSCTGAEMRMEIAVGSRGPRIDANFSLWHSRPGRGALLLRNEKYELINLLYSQLLILAVVITWCGN